MGLSISYKQIFYQKKYKGASVAMDIYLVLLLMCDSIFDLCIQTVYEIQLQSAPTLRRIVISDCMLA